MIESFCLVRDRISLNRFRYRGFIANSIEIDFDWTASGIGGPLQKFIFQHSLAPYLAMALSSKASALFKKAGTVSGHISSAAKGVFNKSSDSPQHKVARQDRSSSSATDDLGATPFPPEQDAYLKKFSVKASQRMGESLADLLGEELNEMRNVVAVHDDTIQSQGNLIEGMTKRMTELEIKNKELDDHIKSQTTPVAQSPADAAELIEMSSDLPREKRRKGALGNLGQPADRGVIDQRARAALKEVGISSEVILSVKVFRWKGGNTAGITFTTPNELQSAIAVFEAKKKIGYTNDAGEPRYLWMDVARTEKEQRPTKLVWRAWDQVIEILKQNVEDNSYQAKLDSLEKDFKGSRIVVKGESPKVLGYVEGRLWKWADLASTVLSTNNEQLGIGAAYVNAVK